MNVELIQHFLLWSLGINYAVLLTWFAVFRGAHDWLYRLHGRWFRLSTESFDALHYGGMAIYKIGVLLFNLTPLLALCLAR
ncbi:hypothetical protein NVV93_18485 [Pseudomonas sp. LS44]|uniref:DUF6868 family protein n=1 Tax=Pseudomonas sp. LS44 TaxID=1357074 RepID=UPI00215B10D5|nr:hypothetical protein [Pseudomonas sp. LS44]UVE17531.1 hypothetical protein NVV93_18485 [Pseudomonas sp. LS44]